MATFTFTPEQLKQISALQAEKAKWKRVIADATKRLADVTNKLSAVETLSGGQLPLGPEEADSQNFLDGLSPQKGIGGGDSAADSDNMTAAIEQIANAAMGMMLTHTEMRNKLRGLGFPEDRLANYYYTAVHRLARRNRITLTDDSKIGRAA